MTRKNANMSKAKVAKNDEFYTQRRDIEAELSHYRPHFKGKTVLCNCDDPMWSQFFRYFVLNFEFLGLKELISTHYEPEGKPSYTLRYNGKIGKLTPMQFLNGVESGSKLPRFKIPLQGDGDFRSDECMKLLHEADVIVTNPPFSLWRCYLNTLISHKKKFIILGNFNAISCQDIWPHVKGERVWLGVHNGPKTFSTPSGGSQSMGNVVWYTNLNHRRRTHEFIPLAREWSKDSSRYEKYDNYGAIEVSAVNEIPEGYKGVMGVPVTFLMKHNPNQFALRYMGKSRADPEFVPGKQYADPIRVQTSGKESTGGDLNTFLTLQQSKAPSKGVYYKGDGKILSIPYTRILISHREAS